MQKPRLNLASLYRMASRNLTQIKSSAYRNQVLNYLKHYLEDLILRLEKNPSPEILFEVEHTLEAIELALVHFWILIPYNTVLTTPNRIPENYMERLERAIQEGRRLNRNLRLAHSRAA